MLGKIVIEDVHPSTPDRKHAAKGVVGRPVRVSADIFRDGHDVLAARVSYRPRGDRKWTYAPLILTGNDRWVGTFECSEIGMHEFTVEAWTDRFGTWRHGIVAKIEAGQDVAVELEEGAQLLDLLSKRVARADRARLVALAKALRERTTDQAARLAAALDDDLAGTLAQLPEPSDHTKSRPYLLWVDRERGLVGAWYELFPRSYGGLRGAAEHLRYVADLGFDVVYLPPVHPIGETFRKGRNNTLTALAGDPGSPWAIGSAEGGHTALSPELGTFDDFDHFVNAARQLDMEVALDYALQCSPDHPWVVEHPEWFHHRPDGAIKYAENPPKKYQDIYPINFWPPTDADRQALWDACRDIFEFWIRHGVRIFRVDNPHTKPFLFWEWVIADLQSRHPETVFLAEAFTRPKIMAKLAEIGFTQSYTYFTWRTAKDELREYLTEVALGPTADYMRPNFWPNTPDILSGPLRLGHLGVFKQRLALAATTSPSYGIYSGYELGENEPASDANEEYLYSEKYEIKHRDFDGLGTLAPWIARVNAIRRRHPALLELSNIRFHHSSSEWVLAYSKHTDDRSDVVLVVVNLDPDRVHDDTLWLDLGELGLPWEGPYEAHDEIADTLYYWHGATPYVRLAPDEPVHILHLRAR
jgi:starch synthase (maltosyl-transferring)